MDQTLKGMILYGFHGLFSEIVFTSFTNYNLTGNTSLIMFPIYAMLYFFRKYMYKWNLRNATYLVTTVLFYELLFGSILKYVDLCPWYYSNRFYTVNNVLNLSYIPAWYLFTYSLHQLTRLFYCYELQIY